MTPNAAIFKKITNGDFPTREIIRERMTRRFRTTEYLNPVIDTCAEEAELLFLRYWSFKADDAPVTSIHVDIKRRSQFNKHVCPNCRDRIILPKHKFCAMCGAELKWV